MKKLLIIPFFFLVIHILHAQTYFNKFYGRPGENLFIATSEVKGVEVTPKKYLIEYTVFNIYTNTTYFNIATLNEHGDTILLKSYQIPATTYWVGDVVVKNNFLYYSGYAFDSIAQKTYFLLMKVNQLGDTIWTKQYSLPYNSGLCARIIETSDKGFILAGWTVPYNYTTGNYGFAKAQIIKVDSSGNLLWSKYYGSANTTDQIYSVVETPEKELIFVGVKNVYYPLFVVDYQYYLFKTDSLGNIVWEKSYGNRDWLEGYTNIIKTKDNNYLLGGGVNYTPNYLDKTPLQLTKINSNGDTLWEKKYFKDYLPDIADMVETADGNIVFTGWIYKFPRPLQQAAGFLYKVNAQGDSLWSRIIDSDTLHDDYINHLSPTSDKGFILTGAGLQPGSIRGEAWIIKVDSLGCTYNGCAISTATHDITEGGHYMTLFPNPASDFMTIEFKTSAIGQEVSLIVTDIIGRQVKSERFILMPQDYHLDVGNMPNGTYFCTLVSNGHVLETKKFSVIK
jgi:hypothetical protein